MGEARCPRAGHYLRMTSGTSGDLRRHADSGDAVCLSEGSFGDGFVTFGGPGVLLKLIFVPSSAKLNLSTADLSHLPSWSTTASW